MSIQLTQLGIRASKANRIIPTPLYNTLSNIELILDATGLRDNTTNSYGVMSGGVVTQWSSISPGPTGRDFTVAGSGSAFKVTDGYINFAGAAQLRDPTGANWNFMHYNAVIANLKWTVHMVCKVGNESNPNAVYVAFGNNGFSAGNKGVAVAFDGRPWIPKTNGIRSLITKGSAGFIIDYSPDSCLTPNLPFVWTIETDMSLSAADRQKHYINGVLISHTTLSASTAVVTTPTFDMDLGSSGNGSLGFFGWMSHVIIQSGIETSGVRDAFIASLLPFTLGKATQFYLVDEARRFATMQTIDETTQYYLCTGLDQHPTTLTNVLKYFIRGTKHTDDDTKKIVGYRSTNRAGSFGSVFDIYDPASTLGVQDMGGGYSANGRHHIICDVHDVSGGVYVAPHTMKYLYSDDDYATSATIVDLTIPSDGLAGIRCYGNLIENNGVLMKAFYKFTDEGDFTNSANYLARSTDGGANWTNITIRASASTYINETTIIALDNSNLIAVARNESTLEYTLFASADNGATWDAGATFTPEALSIAAPGMLCSFLDPKTETKIIGFIYPVKSAKTIVGIFGTAAGIAASGPAGFIAGTKITFVSNSDASNRIIHYFDVMNFKNDFNMICAGSQEPVTVTLTENRHITWLMPSDSWLTVKSALGL